MLFIVIQMFTMKIAAETRLPSELNPFYLVDIAKAGLFVMVLFFLVYREKLSKIEENKFEFKSVLFFGVITILITLGYFWLKEIVLVNTIFFLSYSTLFASLLYLILFLMLFSLILCVYGYKFSKIFYKQFKKEIWIFIGLFILIFFLSNEVQKAWFIFSSIVTKMVYFLLNLSSNPTINLNGKIPIIGLNDFIVGIDKPCSGIESIFLFSILYIFAVCFDWKVLNKKKAVLLFLPGVISVFFLNVIRVYSMILVGAYISKDIALGMFHTNVGWILFLTYFTLFWLLFYRWMKDEKREWMPKDPLYRNSLYLMMSMLVMSFFGFFFWMLNARMFTAEQVGLATTIISISTLIVSFSSLGLGQGIIRYLPKSKEPNKKINTCFTLITIVTIIVTSIFLLSVNEISPRLIFIKENLILSFIFMIFMIFSSWNSLIESVFIAYRNTKYILLKNSVFSVLKLVFPFLLVGLGAYGIFSSWMIALISGFIVVFLMLVYRFKYRPKFVFHDSIIRKIGRYSFGNYVAGFIGGLPALLLPLIITNSLHPEITAYYYMAMMIANLLFIIPSATSSSLFAEGSHSQKELKKHVKKSVKLISLFVIPAIILIIFFGKYVLLLFGKAYSDEGAMFLNLLAISGIFISINAVFGTLFRVKKRIKSLIFISMINAFIVLGGSYLLLDKGLLGIGYSWVIGQGITSLIYLVCWNKKRM